MAHPPLDRPGPGLLRLTDITRRFPDRSVLHGVSLTIGPGERVALVGENGSGKSTLLQIAAGLDRPDSGSVARPPRTTLVHQELPFLPEAAIGEVLDAAVEEARAVERALAAAAETLAELEPGSAAYARTEAAYDTALALAQLTDVWGLGARLNRTLAGLDLTGLPRERRVEQISGGQRSRLALAAALLSAPVALLLDEPTNHLDRAGAAFLAEELRDWGGPVLFATHDRAFIDDIATTVIDLDPAMAAHRPGAELQGVQGTVFRGNYTDYLAAKAAQRRVWAERYAREQDERKALQHEVAVGSRQVFHTTAPKTEIRGAKKFYSDNAANTVARRVRSARSRLEALERQQVTKPPKTLRFNGFDARRRGDDATVLLDLQAVAVAGRLAKTSLRVHAHDRLLVTGPNGSGKTTLLSVAAGILTPSSGTRLVRKGTTIGLLAQDTRWSDRSRSPVQTYAAAARPDAPSLASLGLLDPADLRRPVGALSVGQQRRLALAILLARPPQVLMLDEPTNHLSLTLSEELEAALGDYPGAVVLASHDRWLADRWIGRTLGVDHGPIG